MAMERSNGNGGAAARPDLAAVLRGVVREQAELLWTPEFAAEQAAGYRQTLDAYRRHSREYLAAGDYQQAAEKAWGAYSQSVKSIAADYGVKLAHHAHIIRAGSALATLAAQDDPAAGDSLDAGLGLARSLHQHFYENDLPGPTVIRSAARVLEAIDLMQQRFGLPGGNGGGAAAA